MGRYGIPRSADRMRLCYGREAMRALSVLEPYLRAGLPARLRDLLAIVVIGLSVVLSLDAFRSGMVDDGLTFVIESDRMVVADVSPWGAAGRSSLQPGDVVLRLNQARVNRIAPDREQPVVDAGRWPELLAEPVDYVEALPAELYEGASLSGEEPPYVAVRTFYLPRGSIEESWPAFVAGLVLLAAVWWWLLGHRQASIRRLAAPAAAAISVPLLLLPFALTWGYGTLVLIAVIVPLAMMPLADGLAGMLPPPHKRDARVGLLTVGLVALGGGLLLVQVGFGGPSTVILAALAAGVPIAPAAQLYRHGRDSSFGAAEPVIAPLQPAALSLTPAFALLVLAFRSTGVLWLLVFWAVVLAAGERFTIAPLARAVVRTRLQRDLVVEATEAERARIATDLHDVALQELTMLAMRLDAKGDEDSADAARGVAERIREICGDLRLPLLDDFGVGPALEWLVERLDQATPGRITLEQNEGGRLPAEVELAIFRVAQEALTNAVRHGSPPITVRFRAGRDGASLSIDDAGPGIGPEAAETAQAAGRFGLLNMQQRAEQIGALLDVRRWPTGGTHVALEWRAA
jgi:signal transduction histidine kinase